MTQPTIEEELEALRAIAAKATPGAEYDLSNDYYDYITIRLGDNSDPCGKHGRDNDYRFLESAPRLMALIERQAAEIERQAEQLKELKEFYDHYAVADRDRYK